MERKDFGTILLLNDQLIRLAQECGQLEKAYSTMKQLDVTLRDCLTGKDMVSAHLEGVPYDQICLQQESALTSCQESFNRKRLEVLDRLEEAIQVKQAQLKSIVDQKTAILNR